MGQMYVKKYLPVPAIPARAFKLTPSERTFGGKWDWSGVHNLIHTEVLFT
jgi:hypothetical protein